MTGVQSVTSPTMNDKTTAEPELRNATIIPFPVRQSAKPAMTADQERLATALNTLNTALANQREALAAWRKVLGELKTTTSGLDENLQRYRNSLRTLGNSVSSLRDKTKTLETWADNALKEKE